ncbi:TPA: hypothetical protein DEP21_06625 [Patescibacteria group bacterium]|nr:hypothetical protein [Candidatus Gracilibacteria bacterium]
MKIFDHSLSSYLSIILLIVIISMKGYISNEVEDIAYKCYVGDYFTKQYQFPTILVAPELLIYNTT